MQMYRENDQLIISEKYLKMSAAELRKERERMTAHLKPVTERSKKNVIITKSKTITIKF